MQHPAKKEIGTVWKNQFKFQLVCDVRLIKVLRSATFFDYPLPIELLWSAISSCNKSAHPIVG